MSRAWAGNAEGFGGGGVGSGVRDAGVEGFRCTLAKESGMGFVNN